MVKGAACATQARLVHAVRVSREEAAPQDVGRSVGSEVALARRESPWSGDRFVRTARALVERMPHTLAALGAGVCSEAHAVAMATATSMLSPDDRTAVDRRVGPLLGRLGVKQADRAARRVAAELDAAAVVRRMEAAVASRRVTVRAAADGMAYLTVLGPMAEVVGAHQTLTARARTVVAGHAPDEPHAGRGVGAVSADTALRVLAGREVGQLQPVEVHLVMTDRSLLGVGDPARSVFEPAQVPGHGSVPAPVARWWLRDNGPGATWLRRLFTGPDGRDLVAMDSRRRTFPALLRRMLVLRDDLCTTPHCGAAIAHADHARPARDGGRTSFTEGNGKCARCNHTKEAPGWSTVVVEACAGPPGTEVAAPPSGTSPTNTSPTNTSPTGTSPTKASSATAGSRRTASGAPAVGPTRVAGGRRRRIIVRSPLGRVYQSTPPPLLGWGTEEHPVHRVRVERGAVAGRLGRARRPEHLERPARRRPPDQHHRDPGIGDQRHADQRHVDQRHRDQGPGDQRQAQQQHAARRQTSSAEARAAPSPPQRVAAPNRLGPGPAPGLTPRATSHLERRLCRLTT